MSFFRKSGIIIIFLIIFTSIPFFALPVNAAQLIWDVKTVDAALKVGRYTSMELDSNYRPCISYYDFHWNDLKIAKWNGTHWLNFPYATVGDVGAFSSFALDSNDYIHVSYYDADNKDLIYYYHESTDTTYVTLTLQVDTNGDVGSFTSLALDSTENPHISYYDATNQDLKYAKMVGSSFTTETVDSTGDVGSYSSLALDSNNNPHIIYYDITNQDLKYARLSGTTWTIETVDSNGNVGGYCALALDSNNNPHVSYYDGSPNNNLKYAKKTGNSWTTETIDAAKNVGQYTSIAIDSNNIPHISYYDNNWGDLKYAKLTNHGWLVKNVDNVGNVGSFTSIVLDPWDHPHISYFDSDNNNLKYAKDPDETIWDYLFDAFDSDGDQQNDAVKITFDIDTTFSGTLPVFVYSYATDNTGRLWATNNTLISITSDQIEHNSLILTLPQNAPQDTYNIYLVIEDDSLTIEATDQTTLPLYPPASSQTGTLQGTITDIQTGEPISYAEITINGYTTYTNSTGQYSIDLPAGTYTVEAEELVYSSTTIPGVTIVTNTTTTQDIQLQRSHYILEIQSEGSGTLNPSLASYTYLVGSEVQVQATPNSGWTLAYWLLDSVNVGSQNPYTVTMDSNHALKAVFIEESQGGFLQGTITDLNTGNPIPEAEVIIGDIWLLTDITGNYALEIEAGTYNIIVGAIDYQFQEIQTTVTVGGTTIQDFALEKIPMILIIEILGSGTTNPNSGEHQFPKGTEVTVQANPTEGWMFYNWILEDENIGSENPLTIQLDNHKILVANFVEISSPVYYLMIEVTGSGITSMDLGENGPFPEGESIVIGGEPDSGWKFDNWILNSEILEENPIIITFNQNHTLSAEFSEEPIQQNQRPIAILTVNSTTINVQETINFSGETSYDSDGEITEYFFDFGDGTNSGWIPSPLTSHTYTEQGNFDVSLSVQDNDGLMSQSESTISVTLNVIPEFSSWIILSLIASISLIVIITKGKLKKKK